MQRHLTNIMYSLSSLACPRAHACAQLTLLLCQCFSQRSIDAEFTSHCMPTMRLCKCCRIIIPHWTVASLLCDCKSVLTASSYTLSTKKRFLFCCEASTEALPLLNGLQDTPQMEPACLMFTLSAHCLCTTVSKAT